MTLGPISEVPPAARALCRDAVVELSALPTWHIPAAAAVEQGRRMAREQGAEGSAAFLAFTNGSKSQNNVLKWQKLLANFKAWNAFTEEV